MESCGEKGKQSFHSGHCAQGFGLIPGSFSACTGCSPISMLKFEMLGLDLELGPKLSIHFLDSTSAAQVPKSIQSTPQVCASVVPCKTGLGPMIKVCAVEASREWVQLSPGNSKPLGLSGGERHFLPKH